MQDHGVRTNRDIIDELVRVQGLVEGALGREYLDGYVYDERIKFIAHTLLHTFEIHDAKDFLPKLERKSLRKMITTIFRTATETKTQNM